MTRLRKWLTPMIAVLVFAGLFLGPAASAFASGVSTTIAFVQPAPQTVDFGSNWLVPIKVSSNESYAPVDASSGTVNVYVTGIAGTYAAALPLSADGFAYMSPPSSKGPLAAGKYSLTAVFVPSAGADLNPSQTSTPATITVTALSLAASATVTVKTLENKASAVVDATVTPNGSTQGVPAGEWVTKVKNRAGNVVATNTTAVAANQRWPLKMQLKPNLRRGATYSVSATFTPNSEVAGGYTITNSPTRKLVVSAESVAERLSNPLPLPLWAPIGIGLGIAALVAALLVLILRRRATRTKPDDVDAHPDLTQSPALAATTAQSSSWSLGSDDSIDNNS
jgi:hypothetical protein